MGEAGSDVSTSACGNRILPPQELPDRRCHARQPMASKVSCILWGVSVGTSTTPGKVTRPQQQEVTPAGSEG